MKINPKAKRVLCYGDSNTRGRVPSSKGKQRYSIKDRRPGILQEFLGDDYEVIEEGLGGRTTMFDDPRPDFPERNGLKTLPFLLESHLPLDIVVFMLGTTDTKQMMDISSKQTTQGIQKLIETTKDYKILDNSTSPKIVVVVPPIVQETAEFASKLFIGGTKKATECIDLYKQITEQEGVFYIDPTNEVFVDKEEGVHIDAKNHKKLAEIIYEKILSL